MKRILVTGANGFIGRELLGLLASKGYEVHTLGRTSSACGIHHVCDLLIDDLQSHLAKICPSHLLHLAWNTEPGRFWTAPDNIDWLAASLKLVKAFSASGGRRVACAGTCAEYDWSYETLDELTTPLAPSTLYGTAKAALFQTLDAAQDVLGLSIVWGRIFFPYGPQEKSARLIPTVIDGVAAGQRVPCSEGYQQRDFIHVEDVARAFIHLIEGDIRGPVNIASGNAVAVRDVIAKAAARVGSVDLVDLGARPVPTGEPLVMKASIDRLRSTGFRPHFSLDDGLNDTVLKRLAAFKNR